MARLASDPRGKKRIIVSKADGKSYQRAEEAAVALQEGRREAVAEVVRQHAGKP